MEQTLYRVVEFNGTGTAISKCKVALKENVAKMWAELCNHYKSYRDQPCDRFIAIPDNDPIVQRLNTITNDIRWTS